MAKEETVTYPLRIPKDIMAIIEMRSKEEYIGKSAVLRQILYKAIEEYLLRLCAKGKISIGKVAEILDKSIYELLDSAKEKGIELGATEEQEIEGMKIAEKLS